ncbi:hypothetical protein B0H14DRAFT_1322411 [Mycena olivaceomarginata]|nr:hypothetical protein B0H14DRAFT_1322411 [Mycena olivaceomarginata]
MHPGRISANMLTLTASLLVNGLYSLFNLTAYGITLPHLKISHKDGIFQAELFTIRPADSGLVTSLIAETFTTASQHRGAPPAESGVKAVWATATESTVEDTYPSMRLALKLAGIEVPAS